MSQLGSTGSWSYDQSAQLTAQTGPTGSYSYDDAGQPTKLNSAYQSFDVSGEVCWTAATSGACSASPSGKVDYTYDANGNRKTAGSTSYSYDLMNEMTQSVTSAGTTSYAYSGDGLRVSKKTGSVTTAFAWDSMSSVPELVQDGSNYYIYGPGGLPVERVGTSDTRYLMVDGTGSIAMATDSTTGAISSSRTYDAWGNVTSHTGTPVSLGWQGQYQDPETGFYYLRHRYYDPATAQFTTPDPLFALTRSRYGYAGNDPVNWSDPLGLFGFGAIASEFQGITGGIGPLLNSIGSSIESAVAWMSKNPAAVVTAVSIGACIATGGAGCAIATTIAYGFRAQQRFQDGGWNDSWRANLLDLALTGVTFGTGELVESGIQESTMSDEMANIYATRAVESGFGIGMFAGDQIRGGDMLKRAFP